MRKQVDRNRKKLKRQIIDPSPVAATAVISAISFLFFDDAFYSYSLFT